MLRRLNPAKDWVCAAAHSIRKFLTMQPEKTIFFRRGGEILSTLSPQRLKINENKQPCIKIRAVSFCLLKCSIRRGQKRFRLAIDSCSSLLLAWWQLNWSLWQNNNIYLKNATVDLLLEFCQNVKKYYCLCNLFSAAVTIISSISCRKRPMHVTCCSLQHDLFFHSCQSRPKNWDALNGLLSCEFVIVDHFWILASFPARPLASHSSLVVNGQAGLQKTLSTCYYLTCICLICPSVCAILFRQ